MIEISPRGGNWALMERSTCYNRDYLLVEESRALMERYMCYDRDYLLVEEMSTIGEIHVL